MDYTNNGTSGLEKDHDEQCVDQARQLISGGFMEEEFACYGSAYSEKGEVYYYVSTTAYSMKQFMHNRIEEKTFPTIAKYFVKRANVTPGSKDMMRQMFKKEVASQLKNQYPKVYFQAMEAMATYQNDNGAMDVLFSVKDDLESTFDGVALDLFTEIIEEALLARHLTKDGYRYWQNWVKKERQKTAEEIQEWNHYQRTYTGYGVIEKDKIRYRKDGMESMTIERRNQDIAKGKPVTPILRKQYFASCDAKLATCAKSFQGLMEGYLNDGLFEIIKEIRAQKAVVPKEEFLQWLHRIEDTASQSAIDSFKYYGYLWGVL